KKRKKEERKRRKELYEYRGKYCTTLISVAGFIWNNSFAKLGEDWVFLAILGIIMALISFLMDYGIAVCNSGTLETLHDKHLQHSYIQILGIFGLIILQ